MGRRYIKTLFHDIHTSAPSGYLSNMIGSHASPGAEACHSSQVTIELQATIDDATRLVPTGIGGPARGRSPVENIMRHLHAPPPEPLTPYHPDCSDLSLLPSVCLCSVLWAASGLLRLAVETCRQRTRRCCVPGRSLRCASSGIRRVNLAGGQLALGSGGCLTLFS